MLFRFATAIVARDRSATSWVLKTAYRSAHWKTPFPSSGTETSFPANFLGCLAGAAGGPHGRLASWFSQSIGWLLQPVKAASASEKPDILQTVVCVPKKAPAGIWVLDGKFDDGRTT